MSETLYRKYRPSTFEDVIGQQHIRLTLEHALEHDRLAHAYMFVGPRGVGKTTVARILARAACCQERKNEAAACGRCSSCQAIAAGSSLDVVEIDAASQTGVDNVRENVIQSARAVPTLGRFKVFIIDEVHMLSLSAFNALLKLLEEPPAHALFILATTDVHRVPDTVISRTQRFDFKKIPLALTVERLEKLTVQEKRHLADGIAERIARLSGGSLRDAESVLGQLFAFKEKEITSEIADLILPRSDMQTVLVILQALIRRQAAEAIMVFHQYLDTGGDIDIMAHDLVQAMRALMLLSVDPGITASLQEEYDGETIKAFMELVPLTETVWFVAATETLLNAERQLARSTFPELPLEVAMVTIANPADDTPPAREATVGQPTSPAVPTTPTPKRAATPPSTKKTSLPLAEAWSTVQSQLTAQSPSIALAAKTAVAVGHENGVVTIGVPFTLHRQRLENPKNRIVVEEALAKLYGHPITLTVVSADIPAPPPPVQDVPIAKPVPVAQPAAAKTPASTGGDLWDNVVATFG